MLNLPALAAALTGLVGWHPTDAEPLTEALTESRSGLYVSDLNELLTLDVLRHVVPRNETLPNWLTRVQADALKKLAPQLAAAQGLDGRVVLPETPLLKNPGQRSNTVNKLGRFVGVQLALARHPGVSYSLPSVSIQLDGVLTDPLTLYLYSGSEAEPVATFTVLAENRAYFPYVVPLTGASLDFANGFGGLAYLGYYEDDLPETVRAIHAPVGPCGCADDPFAVWSKFVVARPFVVPAEALAADRLLFEAWQLQGSSDSYGLNLFFQGYCDVVSALESTDNQGRLAPAVQLAFGCRLLEAIVSAPNITQFTARQDVQADAYALLTKYQAQLYGGKDLSTQSDYYPSTLSKLALDLSGLDPICRAQGPASRLSYGQLVR